MKRVIVAGACLLLLSVMASASYYVQFDFNTSWSDDYAPGWENTAYRHGEAPVGNMMQQSDYAIEGSYGLKLTAASAPEAWMWWAGVSPTNVNSVAMQKQYDPWVSVWYLDDGVVGSAGQMFAVPSWVNPYIPPEEVGADLEDWTDVQFGKRFNTNKLYFWHVAAGENSPGWVQDTDMLPGLWTQMKMQLSSTDGRIHFFINDTEVGASYRDDYVDLGSEIGLYTVFQAPLSGWGDNKPYSLWDNFEFGSTYVVPAPGAIVLGSMGIALVGWLRRKGSL